MKKQLDQVGKFIVDFGFGGDNGKVKDLSRINVEIDSIKRMLETQGEERVQ